MSSANFPCPNSIEIGEADDQTKSKSTKHSVKPTLNFNPVYAGSQKDHFVYLYDEMTRREGAPLRATMPDWIIQNCLNLLREREAEAAKGSTLSANSAVAAALEAASANSGGSNGGRPAAPPPPTKGAQTLHAHQVQLQTVYRKHFDIQIMVGITTPSGSSLAFAVHALSVIVTLLKVTIRLQYHISFLVSKRIFIQ